jgi:YbbR domain-containing protein
MRLPNLIVHDVWWKLFSLMVATALWFVIYAVQTNMRFWRTNPAYTRIFEKHPVTVMKSPDDPLAASIQPGRVDVLIGGPPSLLDTITDKDLKVLVDLTEGQAANELFRKVQVFAPEGIKVMEVRPPEVQIERPHP